LRDSDQAIGFPPIELFEPVRSRAPFPDWAEPFMPACPLAAFPAPVPRTGAELPARVCPIELFMDPAPELPVEPFERSIIDLSIHVLLSDPERITRPNRDLRFTGYKKLGPQALNSRTTYRVTE
jgi:hypothetical protein